MICLFAIFLTNSGQKSITMCISICFNNYGSWNK